MSEIVLSARLREACAKSLQEFGYPDATAENITTVWLFGQFAKQLLGDQMHDGPAAFRAACEALIAEIDLIPDPA
jgi:hypothetical protein